ncbi:MAG: hypothetical protein AAGK32_20270, partial [Actinomycetota bacterium]
MSNRLAPPSASDAPAAVLAALLAPASAALLAPADPSGVVAVAVAVACSSFPSSIGGVANTLDQAEEMLAEVLAGPPI